MRAVDRWPPPCQLERVPALGAAHDLAAALDLPEKGVVEHFGLFLVERDDGRGGGSSGLEVNGPDGLLHSVAVDPAFRGEGLTASLLEATLGTARKVGLHAVYLLDPPGR